ncbi:MAG: metal ABC transporter substrate-binding protein [Bacillota bacterium]|nr:metal ABC transporter substrate-binding protein [Bacillota bacterium]
MRWIDKEENTIIVAKKRMGYSMRRIVFLLLLFITVPFAIGCDSSDNTLDEKPSLTVITTIYPLADITRQLGGDLVNVICLLPTGASPHTYEPTVDQARLISEAQMFVFIGAGLDDWGADLANAAGPKLHLIDLSTSVTLLEEGVHLMPAPVDDKEASTIKQGLSDLQDKESDHDHRQGTMNPHYWLDPVIVSDQICPFIFQELVYLLPDEEAYFKERMDNYCNELALLDEEIKTNVASFSSRKFIAFHSAWQYFASRYNLEQAAVIAGSPGREPSAGWIADLIDLVEREQIKAVFAEPQFSQDLADRIAEEGGIEVHILDPLGGENIPGKETYLSLMRYNLAVFREVLD